MERAALGSEQARVRSSPLSKGFEIYDIRSVCRRRAFLMNSCGFVFCRLLPKALPTGQHFDVYKFNLFQSVEHSADDRGFAWFQWLRSYFKILEV
jgi:hypothetical protein